MNVVTRVMLVGVFCSALPVWAVDTDKDGIPDGFDSSPANINLPGYNDLHTFDGSYEDGFGAAVSAAGDVNNDGYPDVIIGSSASDDAGSDFGSAYVYSGQTKGLLYAFHGGFSNGGFGDAVSGAGDVNNDGYADVIVGAYQHTNTVGITAGMARVFSGKNGTTLFTFYGTNVIDRLGNSVNGTGDVNGDGYDDVIIGVPGDDSAGQNYGAAKIFSGKTGKVLRTLNGEGLEDYFGETVSGAGDIDNDGYGDVAVADRSERDVGSGTGRVKVFSGKTGQLLFSKAGSQEYDWFGRSVSGAGDVNNDGYDDFMIGAMGGGNKGYARIYSGLTGGILYTFSGDSNADGLGVSVAAAGDVNNDGYADVIVGAYGDDNAGTDSGSARVFSGSNGSILYTFNGNFTDDSFGYSVASSDINGDGFTDLMVGAGDVIGNDSDAGEVRLFSGALNLAYWDTDGDGVFDNVDNCRLLAGASQTDTDNDDLGDLCDTDDDNDGALDVDDAFPLDAAEFVDTDNDGTGNNADTDDDNDNLPDANDPLPLDGTLLNDANGVAKTDRAGSAIALADIDNDGFADILIGSPLADVTVGLTILKDVGIITMVSGADGSELDIFKGTVAKQQFGAAIAVVADQNSDGTPDLLVGSPLADVTIGDVILKDAGNVSLYSGLDGSLIQSIVDGINKGDKFGAAVAVGDVNNDGYVDMVVGAPLVDTTDAITLKAIKDVGRVYVYNGISDTELYTRTGTQAKGFFGSAVTVNTIDDQLLVGSPGFDVLLPVKLTDTGRVQIFDATDLTGNSAAVFTIPGTAKGDKFGSALGSFNQDLDGDTETDWAVGMPGADILNVGTGKIMKDAGKVKIYSEDSDTGTEVEGTAKGDLFGSAVAADGDVNDDATNDLAIGAPKFDVSKTQKDAGQLEVISGAELF